MKLLGNILWFIFGGFVAALGWFIGGLVCYITIIGIPFGKQCFKYAKLYLAPFGKEVQTNFGKHPIANLLWLIFFGWEMAIANLVSGIIYCITIIGIPFGKQWFKLMSLSLMPFGADIK